jgi:hypothetical protein
MLLFLGCDDNDIVVEHREAKPTPVELACMQIEVGPAPAAPEAALARGQAEVDCSDVRRGRGTATQERRILDAVRLIEADRLKSGR